MLIRKKSTGEKKPNINTTATTPPNKQKNAPTSPQNIAEVWCEIRNKFNKLEDKKVFC